MNQDNYVYAIYRDSESLKFAEILGHPIHIHHVKKMLGLKMPPGLQAFYIFLLDGCELDPEIESNLATNMAKMVVIGVSMLRIGDYNAWKNKKSSEHDELWAHRYLYHILSLPVISDHEYAIREKALIDNGIPASSPFNFPGSDRIEDYPENIVRIAKNLRSSPNGETKP